MKKFVVKILMLGLPVILGLIFINYFGDGAKLFDKDYEREIAEIISEGKNVTNIQNYDERLFQAHLIKNEESCPKIIVAGSSRTMLINSELVEDTLRNNSVSGASIEDIVSIYQLYKDKGMFPDKIIIGVDPWTFNENSNQRRWQSIANSYYRFHKKKKVSDTINNELDKIKQLVSLTYFQSSFSKVPQVITGDDKPVATDDKYNTGNTRLTDGSLIYGEQTRDISDDKVEGLVQEFISNEIYGLHGFNTISERIWNEFELLIKDMEDNGVEVTLFMAPYHPDAYYKVVKEYPLVVKAEQMVTKFAAEKNIKVIGSFNPDKAGLNGDHFYDAMHCSEEGVRLLLKSGDILDKFTPEPMLVSK